VGVDLAMLPPNAAHVRANNGVTGLVFTPVSKPAAGEERTLSGAEAEAATCCRVAFVVNADIMGWVPRSVIALAMTGVITKDILRIKRLAEEESEAGQPQAKTQDQADTPYRYQQLLTAAPAGLPHLAATAVALQKPSATEQQAHRQYLVRGVEIQKELHKVVNDRTSWTLESTASGGIKVYSRMNKIKGRSIKAFKAEVVVGRPARDVFKLCAEPTFFNDEVKTQHQLCHLDADGQTSLSYVTHALLFCS
jgi:hypothetical protein